MASTNWWWAGFLRLFSLGYLAIFDGLSENNRVERVPLYGSVAC